MNMYEVCHCDWLSVTPAACMKLRFTYIFMKLTCIVEKLETLEVQAYVR